MIKHPPVVWILLLAVLSFASVTIIQAVLFHRENRPDSLEPNVFEIVARAFNPICYSLNERDHVHTAPDDAVFRAAKRLDIPKHGEEERLVIYTAILLESWERGVADIALESVISENETAQFRGKLVAFWKSRIELMAEVDHGIDWKGRRLFDGMALLASKDQEDYIECWGKIGSFFSEKTSEISPEHGKQLMNELEKIFAETEAGASGPINRASSPCVPDFEGMSE